MTAARALTHATRYLDPARMKAWLRSAPAGDRLIYASGASLEGGRNPAAVLARELAGAGEVGLLTQRAGAGITDYMIEKRAGRKAASPSVAPARTAGGDLCAEIAQKSPLPTGLLGELYGLLVEAAEAGADCPGHGALADALDLPTREKARYLCQQLEVQGFVRQIEPARYGARVIEIVATGKRTRSQGAD